MVAHRPMDNPEEVLQRLEEVSRRRPGLATIPRVLDDYLEWVARTGEPFYPWSLVKHLLKEKLAAVVAEYRAAPPGVDVPPCPNVPPFDCDAMRGCFLARLDAFPGPPFTIQRICELLAHPRKHYNRVDKFMRAFEKNVLVVGTKEPEAFARFARIEPDAFARAAERRLDAASDASVDVEADDVAEWRPPIANGPAEPPTTERPPSPPPSDVAPTSPPASVSPPPPDVERDETPPPPPEPEPEPEPVDEPAPACEDSSELAEQSSPQTQPTEPDETCPEREKSPEPILEPPSEPTEPDVTVEQPAPQPDASSPVPDEPEIEPMDCTEDAPPEEPPAPVVERIDEA